MNLATGAMNTLFPKLADLLVGEYKLQKGVKGEIKELEEELTSILAALCKVAEVPADQLDEQVKIWASHARDLSYDIEDVIDTFMLQHGKEHEPKKPLSLKGLIGRATDLYNKAKTNHQIHNAIKDIMDQVKKVGERRDKYKVDNIAARPAMVPIDPRLEGMYREATELVGTGKPKKELANRLLTSNQSNIISIVGFGGLGKTTLANSFLQGHMKKFDCHIFVSVSLNPDIKKIFKNILLQLDKDKFGHMDEAWEVKQLIDKIIEFLKKKRFLCVIDDIWKESAWDIIKVALHGGNHGSKIIVTTRSKVIAEHVGGSIYELKPLSNRDSRKLLNKRIFGTEARCPPELREITGDILNKCGGVPLAIITTASLLASKPMHSAEWEKVNKSIGSGLGNSLHVDKMRKILSLSYTDLPFHLKTCLLSLSKYPEDQVIRKDVLLWSWIAEGFITTEETQAAGTSLQEIAESYFSDLINRSLIQPVLVKKRLSVIEKMHLIPELDGQVHACQVHDMVLELINQISAREGFITTLLSDGQQGGTHPSVTKQKKIRRLYLHNSNNTYTSPEAREQLSKVRSLDLFGNIVSMPLLSSFGVLRVLQIDDCTGLDNTNLNNLCDLVYLRFLRLYGLKVTELPESIGKLMFLETLDIRGTSSVILLPVSFGKLGKLVRLVANKVKLPDGMSLGSMKSLQELVGVLPTMHALTEICKLRELKVIILYTKEHPRLNSQVLNELILKCLQMCPSLQVLVLTTTVFYSLDFMAQVPSSLQRFVSDGIFEKAFPRWIDPSLSCLTILSIKLLCVRVLPEHLDKLAGLPSLRFLRLEDLTLSNKEQEMLTIPGSASAFPSLTDLHFESEVMYLKFQQGAMRKLQRLRLLFNAGKTINAVNSLDYGIENLLSLRHAIVRITGESVCLHLARRVILKAVNNKDNTDPPSLDYV